jgi:hypothetical protein
MRKGDEGLQTGVSARNTEGVVYRYMPLGKLDALTGFLLFVPVVLYYYYCLQAFYSVFLLEFL